MLLYNNDDYFEGYDKSHIYDKIISHTNDENRGRYDIRVIMKEIKYDT